MDRATLHNVPREFTLAGKAYSVTPLTEKEKGQLQAWLKARHPGPLGALDDATLSRFSPANQKKMIDAAVAQAKAWPPRVGSLPWWEAMDHVGGGARFLHAVLSRANEIGMDEAEELNQSLSQDEVNPLILFAMWGLEAPTPGPKAAGATTGGAGDDRPASPTP